MVLAALSVCSLAYSQQGSPKPRVVTPQVDGGRRVSAYDLMLAKTRELNWRTKTVAEFELKLLPRAATKATAVVWAFGRPKELPHGPGRVVQNDQLAKLKVGRIVHVQPIGMVQGEAKFTIDFADFAPRASNFIIMQAQPKGLSPNEQMMANAAQAMAAQNKTDATGEMVEDGTVQYHVQVITEDGSASPWSTIRYGEPKPTGATKLEYLSLPGTPEFPDEQWTDKTSVSKSNPLRSFRYQLPRAASQVKVQVIDGEFRPEWALWCKAAPELYSTTVSGSSTNLTKFTLPSDQFLSKAKKSKLSIRLIPLGPNGDLAAMPSNFVVLDLVGDSAKPPAPAAQSKISYQVEVVGWEPAYLGAPDDAYRFVIGGALNPQISGDVTKILGKTPAVGDKIYLPPQPPKEEDAWYTKVWKAITTVIDVIYESVKLAMLALPNFTKSVLKAGPNYLAEKAGVSKSSMEKAWSVAETPFTVANEAASVPMYIHKGKSAFVGRMLDDMGVKDKSTRQLAQGNLEGLLSDYMKKNSYMTATSGPMQGLAPDPDFRPHTAIAYFKVKASILLNAPANYREPGPMINFKVGAFAGDASNLGIQPLYYELFDTSYATPTFAPGEEMIIAIPLKYHWTYDQRKEDWMTGMTRSQQVRWTLNGKTMQGKPLFKKWGTTVN